MQQRIMLYYHPCFQFLCALLYFLTKTVNALAVLIASSLNLLPLFLFNASNNHEPFTCEWKLVYDGCSRENHISSKLPPTCSLKTAHYMHKMVLFVLCVFPHLPSHKNE